MNSEENRLETFSFWPSDAVIDASRIAKAGFFCTGEGLEVQCFACGGKISEWNYGDQVMARHRLMGPQCPFVLNPSTSGNIPKLSTSSLCHQNTSLALRSERARLDSYTNWPSSDIVSPESLAKAGFYYLQSDDKVKCAFCSGICGFWERGDEPKSEHKRHFPNCSFVRANFNLENNKYGSTNSLDEAIRMQEMGIQSHRGPKHPRFATLESRLRSFANWDTNLIQTPEMLAEAGFYHAGTGDQVRCFYCDGGLRHWDPQDIPWSEHARWFPTCGFVILVKGHDFIGSSTPRDPALSFNDVDTIELSADLLDAYLFTTQAQAALSVGISRTRVKTAIKFQLQRHGTMFTSIDALIDAALKLQVRAQDERDGNPPRRRDERSRSERYEDANERISEPRSRNNSAEPSSRHESTSRSSTSLNVPNGRNSRSQSPKVSLEEENRQLKEARLCKICLDNEIGVVFLPCGHLSTCITCATSLKTCPVCRAVIKGTVRTFMS